MAGPFFAWGQFPWGVSPWGGYQLTQSQQVHMSTLQVAIQTDRTIADLINKFETAGGKHEIVQRLQNYVSSVQTGTEGAVAAGQPPAIGFAILEQAVAAFGTLTFAASTAGDTFTVNSVVFTAVAGAPGANQFQIGGTNAQAAASAASAINASISPRIQGYVTASSAGAVVTVTSAFPGISGNQTTLGQTAPRIVRSASFLQNGAADPGAQTLTF